MHWSKAFLPTLRDDPADAEAVSHKLLVRAGFVRQLAAGLYSLLPLGQRTCAKVAGIVRQEMEKIGAQEFLLPSLLPAEIWKQSGRWDGIGDEMFRLKDRGGADLCLGMTHEEIFTWVARELRSYKRAAADLVPDPDQVPRRAAAEVRPAARARVRDEGLLLLRRPTRPGSTSRSRSTSRRIGGSSTARGSTRSPSRPRRA